MDRINHKVPAKITVSLDGKQDSGFMSLHSNWIEFEDDTLKGRLAKSEMGSALYLVVEHQELGHFRFTFNIADVIVNGMEQILNTQDWYCVKHTSFNGLIYEMRFRNIRHAIHYAEANHEPIRIDRNVPNGTYDDDEGLTVRVDHFGGYFRD